MTISVAQSAVLSTAAWSGNFGSNVGSGDTVFLVATGYNNTNVTISSSAPLFGGSAVSGAVKVFEKSYPWDGSVTDYVVGWMLPNLAGGSASLALTVSNSLAITPVGLMAWDVTGLGSNPTVDQAPTPQEGFTNSLTSGTSGAIGHAPEFILGAIVQDGTEATTPSGFTNLETNAAANSIAGYQIASSSGGTYSYAMTATSNVRWAGGLVTVYAGSAAPGGSGLLMASFP